MEIWRPTFARPMRRDLPLVPFGIWSLFHFLGVFASRDYFLVLVLAGPRLVHRTCIFPAHFRFPFMAIRDLQAGGLWTDPGWRGRSQAWPPWRQRSGAPSARGGPCGYMVRENNRPSIRLAEKAGFLPWGRGGRVDPWGIGALGRYEVEEVLPSDPPGRGSVWEPDPS